MDGVCGGRSCRGRIPGRVRKYPQTGQERSRSGGAPPGPVGTEPRGAGRRYGPHPEDHYLPQAGRHGAFHYARGRRFAVGREDDVGGHRRGGHFGLEPPQPGGAQRQDQRRVRRVGPAGIAGPELAAGRRSATAQGADTLAFDPLVYSGDRFRTMRGANMRVTTTTSDGSSTARITSSGSATREPMPAIWTAWRSSGRSMPTPKPVWNG